MLKQFLYLLFTLTVLTVNVSFADTIVAETGEVVIVDVNNQPRASALVEDIGRVEFELVADENRIADGVDVTLTNKSTGEAITRTVIDGVVVFEDVPPGVWEVSSSVDWVTFTSASITSSAALLDAGLGLGASTIIPKGVFVVAAGAAATATGIAIHNNNEENHTHSKPPTPLSPSS